MIKKTKRMRRGNVARKILAKINIKKIQKVCYDLLLVVLIPFISIVYEEISENRKLINDINSIAIGESCEHFSDCFGGPFFQKEHTEVEINERIYINSYAIIRAYFKNDSLIAFFVTARDEKGNVELPKQFGKFCEDKALGRFSFSDILYGPSKVYSYAMNGAGYTYYGEEYYFTSVGNYYDFYFTYMEYGFSKMDYDTDAFFADSELENADVQCRKVDPCVNRSTSYPNTYGIVAEDREIIEKLAMNYMEFNFRSLKYE